MTWKTVKLGDVCKIINGSTPLRSRKDYWEEGTIPWFTIDDFREQGYNISYTNQKITKLALKETSVRMLPKNTVLLCCTASVGASAITRVEMATNQQFNGLIPNTDELIPEFLYYISTTITQKLINLSGSATINFIPISKLKEIEVSFPSILEQQRIVAKLAAAFAEIDKAIQLTKKKIIEIEQFSAQALTSIYFDKKNKSLKKLNEIVSIKGGKRLPKGKKLTTENTGFPYIRVSDFNDDGTINLKSVKFIEADVQKQIERYTISSKDVYVSIAGTIGKTGIVPEILENANLTENAVKLIPHESVDKEFLYFFTKTTSFKKQAIKQTRTAAQPKLALERLGKVEIPLFDLKKQIKIISEARNIILWMKLTKENCYNKIEHLVKLKSAILIQKLRPKKAA